MPEITDDRERVLDELTAYQMVSILQGVVQRGTGARLAQLGQEPGGQDRDDERYQGRVVYRLSPDMVAGVYIGFDEPRTLGRVETGAGGGTAGVLRFYERGAERQAEPRIPRAERNPFPYA